jgi:hypothetical protein
MVSTRLALANLLVGGRLAPILRLAALGAALRRAVRHVGEPAAQLLGGQLADREVAERGENVHVAAAAQIADRLALLVLVVDVAVYGLPHGEADDQAVAVAVWAGDHRVRLGLGLLEAQHVGTIGAGGIVRTPQGLHPVLARRRDVPAQQPAPRRVALPALPAEMHPAFDERLPMWLAAALEPGASRLALQACVLDGAAHPSSLIRAPFTVWFRASA